MSDINFKISSDSRQAQADLQKLNKSVSNIEQTANNAASTISSLAKGLAAAVAGFSIGSAIKNSSDSFARLNTQISLSVKNINELAKVQSRLFTISQNTRTSIESTAIVFNGLARSLDKSTDQILAVTATIQKAGIISGGSADSISSAMIQLNQGLQSGTLRGEELNSVLEQTPRLGLAIAEGMGVARGSLRKLAEEGKITTEVIFNALNSQAAKIADEFTKVTPTIATSLNKIGDSVKLVVGETAALTGLAGSITGTLDGIASSLADNRSNIVTNLFLIGESFKQVFDDTKRVVNAFAPIVKFLGEEFLKLIPVIDVLGLRLSSLGVINLFQEQTKFTLKLSLALRELGLFGTQVSNIFGSNFKSDFFDALIEISKSRSLAEFEKNMKGLTESLLKTRSVFSALTSDVELTTLALDAIDFRNITAFAQDARKILVSFGLLENKLLVIGNIRTDKLQSLLDYFVTFIDFIRTAAVSTLFRPLVLSFQKFTLTVGAYFLELGQTVGGFFGSFLESIGNFIYGLSGFSSTLDYLAKGVVNFSSAFTLGTLALGRSINILSSGFAKIAGLSTVMTAAFKDIKSAISSDLLTYISSTFSKVFSITKSRLSSVLDFIKDFGIKVKGYFFDIYDAVVGNSYWPDMVEGVIEWTEHLYRTVIKRLTSFSSKVKSIFNSLSNTVTDSLNVDLSSSLETAKEVGKVIGAYTFALPVAGLFDAALISKLFNTFRAELAFSAILALEEAVENFSGSSLFEKLGNAIGTIVGSATVRLVESLPSILDAFYKLTSGFVSGLTEQFGVLGSAVKGIANIVTFGNAGIVPYLLFGSLGIKYILGAFTSIGEGLNLISKSTAKASGISILDKLLGTGKTSQGFILAGLATLLSSVSTQIGIFSASLAATPLLLVGILGTDVTGKILSTTAVSVLTKLYARLTAATLAATASGTLLSVFLGLASQSKLLAGLSSFGLSAIAVLKNVLDVTRKEQFLSGAISLTTFLFGGDAAKALQPLKSLFTSAKSLIFKEKAQLDLFASSTGPKGQIDLFPASTTNALKDRVSGVFNSIKTSIASSFVSIQATAVNATNGIASSFTKLNTRIVTIAGPFGAFGKFLFGKIGTIAAVLALITLFTSEANAATSSVTSKALEYATNAGLIAGILFGFKGSRNLIAKGLSAITSRLGIFAATSTVSVSAVAGSFTALGATASAVGASLFGPFTIAAAAIAALGVALYSVGEGDSILENLSSGAKKIGSSLGNAVVGFKYFGNSAKGVNEDIIKLTNTFRKTTEELDSSLGEDFSAKFTDLTKYIAAGDLTARQLKEFEKLASRLTESSKAAKAEVENEGVVAEETQAAIERLFDRIKNLSERVGKFRSGQLSQKLLDLDGLFGSAEEAAANSKSYFERFFLAIESSYINARNNFASSIGSALGIEVKIFDNEITIADAERNLNYILGILSQDADKAIGKFAGTIREASAKARILTDLFPDSKTLSAENRGLAEALDQASRVVIKRSEELTAAFKSGNDAQIAEAERALAAAIQIFTTRADRLGEIGLFEVQGLEFRKGIDAFVEGLRKADIEFNKNNVFGFNSKNIDIVAEKLRRLSEVTTELLNKSASAAQASRLLSRKAILEAEIQFIVDRSSAIGLRAEIENLIKSAGNVSVTWEDFLGLDFNSFQLLKNKLKSISDDNQKLNLAQFNGDITSAAFYFDRVTRAAKAFKKTLDEINATTLTDATNSLTGASAALKDFVNFTGLSTKDQERLKELRNKLSLFESDLGDSKNKSKLTASAKTRIASEIKALIDEQQKLIDKATKPQKSVLESLTGFLSDTGLSLNLSDLFSSGIPLSKVLETANKIKAKIAEINKLKTNNDTGLPIDTARFDVLNDELTKLQNSLNPKTLDNLFSGVFNLVPEQLKQAFLDRKPEVVKAAQEAFKAIQDATKLKSTGNPLVDLFNFVQAQIAIKDKTEALGDLVGTTLSDRLSALNLDYLGLGKYSKDAQQQLLDLSTKIIAAKKVIAENTDANIFDPKAAADLAAINAVLDKLKEKGQSIGGALSALNLDYGDINKLGAEAFVTLAKSRNRILEIQKELNDASLSELEGKQGIIAEIQKRLDLEKETFDVLRRQQEISNSVVSAGKDSIKTALFEGGLKPAITQFLDQVTSSVVDNFVNQFAEFAFRGLGDALGGILNPLGEPGSSPTNPMYVTDASKAAEGLFGGKDGKGPLDGIKEKLSSAFDTVKDSLSNTFDSLKSTFSELFKGLGSSLSSVFGSISSSLGGLFSGGGGLGGLFSGVSSLFSTPTNFSIAANPMFGGFFSEGGIVPGGSGAVPIIAHAGEVILNESQQSRVAAAMQSRDNSGQQQVNINITGDISRQTRQEILTMSPQIAEMVRNNFIEKRVLK